MKKFMCIIFIAIFANFTVYASDDWKTNYDEIEKTVNEQVYICSKQIGKNIKHYVTDENGNILFETNDSVKITDDPNRYICWKDNYNSETEKYDLGYYIADGKGNPVNDIIYHNINHKIEDLNAYAVQKDEGIHTMGIVDDSGKELLSFEYDIMDFNFVNGYLRVTKNDEKQSLLNGLVDKNFNVVIPAEYKSVVRINENLFYASKKSGDYYDWYKYENGNLSYFKSTDWNTGSDFSLEKERYIDIIKDYNNGERIGHGLADKNLNVICEPEYDSYIDFENDYAVVQYGSTDFSGVKTLGNLYNGKYGVIDRNGNEVIKCEYDKIIRPEKGGFICTKDGKRDIFLFDTNIDEPKCSSWAKNSIICGELYGIVPEEINNNFSEKITREEFCKLAVQTYLKTEGYWNIDEYIKNFAKDIKNPFNDTNDKYIMLANYKGIVNGKENGKFCPNDTITRQEAAVMISNMAKAMNYNLISKNINFADEQYFADWAKESIYKIVNFKGEENLSVMTETENGKFSPLYSYSREQAIASMVRIYDIREHTFRNDYNFYSGL